MLPAESHEGNEEKVTIEGRLVRVKFRAVAPDEQGDTYVVLLLATREGGIVEAKGTECNPDELIEDRHYRVTGSWDTAYRGKRQLRWWEIHEIPANSLEDVADFIHRRGKLTKLQSARVVKLYKVDAADAIIGQTATVAKRCKIKEKAVRKAAGLLAQFSIARCQESTELHTLLRKHRCRTSDRTMKAILNKYRLDAVRTVRDEPYLMLRHHIPDISFTVCDRIYLAEGGEERQSDPIRGAFAAWDRMHRDESTVFGTDDVVDWLQSTYQQFSPDDALTKAKDAGLIHPWKLRDGEDVLSVAVRHRQEGTIAAAVHRAKEIPPHWPSGPFAGLNAHQSAALDGLLMQASRIAHLGGSPGTGKTFVAASAARTTADMYGPSAVAWCALAARAALRGKQTLTKLGASSVQASTIHKLLEAIPTPSGFDWRRNRKNPLEQRLIVLDEASMVDVSLFARLLDAIDWRRTNLLLVGDLNQLAPVGAGAPLRDMVWSHMVPSVELTEIVRNSGHITHACSQLRRGRRFTPVAAYDPTLDGVPGGNITNVTHRPVPLRGDIAAAVMEVYAGIIDIERHRGIDAIEDLIVLTGTNALRHTLNRLLQQWLNPNGESLLKSRFRCGDKVICQVNSRFEHHENKSPIDVSNGDLGRIISIDQRRRRLIVRFDADRIVSVPVSEIAKPWQPGEDDKGKVKTGCPLDLGYCVTGHKSQGSEWLHAIIAVAPGDHVGCVEWTYTVISRAVRATHLVGDLGELWRQCRLSRLAERRTGLVDLLSR